MLGKRLQKLGHSILMLRYCIHLPGHCRHFISIFPSLLFFAYNLNKFLYPYFGPLPAHFNLISTLTSSFTYSNSVSFCQTLFSFSFTFCLYFNSQTLLFSLLFTNRLLLFVSNFAYLLF
ncbi:hypothetical protein M1627_1530 [Sulfolobus islandicus M.16.27]|uniref:Uncharacterized protein n=1 Tax=Saccharolobus islandicus (strain M.16.27) TaxID=427318 RepID=C3N5Y8_SACI3|nr:hypothetical protein M1627_1530 [Sulfolobus islandicus M.16.27]